MIDVSDNLQQCISFDQGNCVVASTDDFPDYLA